MVEILVWVSMLLLLLLLLRLLVVCWYRCVDLGVGRHGDPRVCAQCWKVQLHHGVDSTKFAESEMVCCANIVLLGHTTLLLWKVLEKLFVCTCICGDFCSSRKKASLPLVTFLARRTSLRACRQHLPSFTGLQHMLRAMICTFSRHMIGLL